MKLIKAPNLARAHELAVEYVYKTGTQIETEDGEQTLESDEICIEIRQPFSEPMLSEKSPIKKKFAEIYKNYLLLGTDSDFEYDYYSRLCLRDVWDLEKRELVTIDQIQYIIDKLKSHPQSRRALAITWDLQFDLQANDVPCLQLVQCSVRDGKLDMKVVFRSNDMLLALGANMYGLVHLQKKIADEIGVEVGKYTHISLIPHIYQVRDENHLSKFIEGKSVYDIS